MKPKRSLFHLHKKKEKPRESKTVVCIMYQTGPKNRILSVNEPQRIMWHTLLIKPKKNPTKIWAPEKYTRRFLTHKKSKVPNFKPRKGFLTSSTLTNLNTPLSPPPGAALPFLILISWVNNSWSLPTWLGSVQKGKKTLPRHFVFHSICTCTHQPIIEKELKERQLCRHN